MNKITTVNGVLVAAQSDFAGHAEDKTIHLTEEERAAWNAKADASALSGKVDTGTFTAHETNTTVHVSQEEKEKWNARNTKGVVTATQDGLDEHTENTTVHITEEERTAWNEATAIPGASNAFTGDNTHAGTETFSGPVILNGVTTKLAEYGDSSIPTRLQMRAASQAAIYAWDGFADTRVIPGKLPVETTYSEYNRLVEVPRYDGVAGEKETVDPGNFSICSELGLYSIHTYGGRFLSFLGMRMEDIPHVKPGAHTWSVTAGGSRGWHWKHSALAYFNNYNLSESDLSAGRCRRFVYVMDQRDESLLYAAILPCSSINSASYIRFLVAGDKSPNQNYLSFFINNSFFAPVQAYPVKEFPEEQGGGFYMKSKSNDVLKYCTINNLQPHGLAIPVLHELTAYRQPAEQADVTLGCDGDEYTAAPEGESFEWSLNYPAKMQVDGAALDEWVSTPAPTSGMNKLTLNIDANETGAPRWTWLIYGVVGQRGKALKIRQEAL